MKKIYRTPNIKIHNTRLNCGVCETSPSSYPMTLSVNKEEEGELTEDM